MNDDMLWPRGAVAALERAFSALESEKTRSQSIAKQLIRHINAVTDITVGVFDCWGGKVVVAVNRNGAHTPIEWTTAVSLCSPSDEFDLLFGLNRALGRLRKNPIVFDPLPAEVLKPMPVTSALRAVRSKWRNKLGVPRWPSWAQGQDGPTGAVL